MSTKIFRYQGDLEPDLPLEILTRDTTKNPQCFPRDLTGLSVRALFYKPLDVLDDPCAGLSTVSPANAIFYRELVKVENDLVDAMVSAPTMDTIYDPVDQPASAQVLSIEITNFVAGGTITITGTDADGDALTEDVVVAADGALLTTAAFASIDEDGFLVTAASEFDFRVFVYDGRVDLVWEDGDLAEAGEFALLIELVDSGGETETSKEPIEVQIREKIPYPLPVLEVITVGPWDVGDTITFTGKNFLRATAAVLRNTSTGVETNFDSFLVISEKSATGDVPAALDGGNYTVYILGPGGPSNVLGPVAVLPVVTDFSPTSLAPGATLTLTGEGFTGATAIEIVQGATVIALDALVVGSDLSASGDIPLATASGDYEVRIVLPANQSTLLGTLTVT